MLCAAGGGDVAKSIMHTICSIQYLVIYTIYCICMLFCDIPFLIYLSPAICNRQLPADLLTGKTVLKFLQTHYGYYLFL